MAERLPEGWSKCDTNQWRRLDGATVYRRHGRGGRESYIASTGKDDGRGGFVRKSHYTGRPGAVWSFGSLEAAIAALPAIETQ
mgnify:CR=1 FL=1